jgi:hypothetical protein
LAVSQETKTGGATFDILLFWKKNLQQLFISKKCEKDLTPGATSTRINFIPYEAMMIQSSKQAMVKLKQKLHNTALYERDCLKKR